MIDRHVDELVRDKSGTQLTSVLDALTPREHLTGACEITIGDGSSRRVRYDLCKSTIPNHHVWALAPEHDC
jgi:hypothetical protein